MSQITGPSRVGKPKQIGLVPNRPSLAPCGATQADAFDAIIDDEPLRDRHLGVVGQHARVPGVVRRDHRDARGARLAHARARWRGARPGNRCWSPPRCAPTPLSRGRRAAARDGAAVRARRSRMLMARASPPWRSPRSSASSRWSAMAADSSRPWPPACMTASSSARAASIVMRMDLRRPAVQCPCYFFTQIGAAIASSGGYTVTGVPFCHWMIVSPASTRRPLSSNLMRPPG